MKRSPLAFLLAASCVALTGFALPASAQPAAPPQAIAGALSAQETTPGPRTWGIVPAPQEGAQGEEAEQQDERVSFRFTVEPGQSVSDAVEVQNFSDEELTFALTASDGIVTSDGVFDILPSDREPEDLGSWVQIDETVTIPAQDSAVVPFTIQVPSDALPGDHPGGITASLDSTSADGSVSLDARVGVRIHMRVAGDLVPEISLEDVQASYQTSWNPFAPGTLTLDYTVANSGNVRVGSVQELEVAGPFGLGGTTLQEPVGEQREVLPRQSAPQQASVEIWPLGRATAQLTATQNVVGEDEIQGEISPTSAEVTTWAIPWPQLIILALVLLIALLWWNGRRRSKKKMATAVEQARAEGRAEAGSTSATSDAAPSGATAAGTDQTDR